MERERDLVFSSSPLYRTRSTIELVHKTNWLNFYYYIGDETESHKLRKLSNLIEMEACCCNKKNSLATHDYLYFKVINLCNIVYLYLLIQAHRKHILYECIVLVFTSIPNAFNHSYMYGLLLELYWYNLSLVSRHSAVLGVSVACLQLFVQNNWVGPPTDQDPVCFLPEAYRRDKHMVSFKMMTSYLYIYIFLYRYLTIHSCNWWIGNFPISDNY